MCCNCAVIILLIPEYSRESNQCLKNRTWCLHLYQLPPAKEQLLPMAAICCTITVHFHHILCTTVTALLHHMCCTTTAHLQHMLCSIICIFTALLQHMCCIITAHLMQFDSTCATILLLSDIFIDFIIDLLSLCFGYC